MSAKYRDRIQIIRDILEAANVADGVSKTKIMNRAYVAYDSFQLYLDEVMSMGLLAVDDYGRLYTTTAKGHAWLAVHSQLADLMVVAV